MQRLLNNLLTVAVIGLVSTSASLVMAHGGGGGGHSSGGHSSAGHSSGGHSGSSHSGASRSVAHKSSSHTPLTRDLHSRSAGSKGDHKPTNFARLAGNGNPPAISRNTRRFTCRVTRGTITLHYPVGFWFGGDYDVADAGRG